MQINEMSKGKLTIGRVFSYLVMQLNHTGLEFLVYFRIFKFIYRVFTHKVYNISIYILKYTYTILTLHMYLHYNYF